MTTDQEWSTVLGYLRHIRHDAADLEKYANDPAKIRELSGDIDVDVNAANQIARMRLD